MYEMKNEVTLCHHFPVIKRAGESPDCLMSVMSCMCAQMPENDTAEDKTAKNKRCDKTVPSAAALKTPVVISEKRKIIYSR